MNSSAARILANRANALQSTGPVSASGKARSAANSLSHGLHVEAENSFRLPDSDQEDFDGLLNGLRPQLQPKGYLEEKLFRVYCWALFQSDRARDLEAQVQAAWQEDLSSEAKFKIYDRMTRLRTHHERSAERAFRELGRLQFDRFAANQINEHLKHLGFKDKTISIALPASRMRSGLFRKNNPAALASEEISGYPDINPPPSR